MGFVFGKQSEAELRGVHGELVRVARRALVLSPVDFAVHDGIRTLKEQQLFVARGVSWTMESRHLVGEDGLGHAVDLVPVIGGSLRWEWPPLYKIADAVRRAALELAVPVRWGGFWGGSTRSRATWSARWRHTSRRGRRRGSAPASTVRISSCRRRSSRSTLRRVHPGESTMAAPTPERVPDRTPTENGNANVFVVYLCTVLTWIAGIAGAKVGVPAPPDDVSLALHALMLGGLAWVFGVVASRARREQWLVERNVTGLKRLLVVPLALALSASVLVACASYDRVALSAAASKFAAPEPVAVTAEECGALDAAAVNLRAGPDKAMPVLGRASDLEKLARLFEQHAVQCSHALEIDVPEPASERIRGAFRRSWQSLLEVLQ